MLQVKIKTAHAQTVKTQTKKYDSQKEHWECFLPSHPKEFWDPPSFLFNKFSDSFNEESS